MTRSSFIAAALCGMFAASAQAATSITWDLTTGLSGGGNNPSPNTRSKEVSSQTISLQALYTNGTNQKLTIGSGSAIAGVSTWSGGVGICNDTTSNELNPNGSSSCGASPNHAIDNNGTADDYLLISFESFSWVDSLKIGWTNGPADISVYLAPEDFNPASVNLTNGTICPEVGGACSAANSLAGAGSLGFQKVSFTGKNAGDTLSITPTEKTKYVLVSGALGQYDDYFKVSAVTVRIPEPGTIALLGLGLLGMVAILRRRTASTRLALH